MSQIHRRDFLRVVGTASGGLVLGVRLPASADEAAGVDDVASAQPFAPNAWVRIQTDGTVTVVVNKSEMGQGISTSLPMLVAEELDADWSKVRYEFAPAAESYKTPLGPIRMQVTGGSTSVRMVGFPILRAAGAAARQMLVGAAAAAWGVAAASCRTENGFVLHPESARRLGYGELATPASRRPLAADPPLKDPSQYRLLGKPMARLDVPSKVDGTAEFGIDVVRPGMLSATVLRCPVLGGKAAEVDATAAKEVPGVRHVVETSSGVAVVADDFWSALQGRKALQVRWDEGENASLSSAAVRERYAQLVEEPGAVARHHGDAAAVIQSSERVHEAVYEVPFLAHATLEPMNATADVGAERCDVWAPTQNQTAAHDVAARISGLGPEKVHVHTTFLGGGFGRRAEVDFVADAVEASKAVGRPVKVTWTREDDTRHDYYRPAATSRLAAALGEDGLPKAWLQRTASPSIMSRVFPGAVRDGVDGSSVEGAVDQPYAFPAMQVEYHLADVGVPVGFWRSVGHSQNAFFVESFLDELAAAGGKDPLELRKVLLSNAGEDTDVARFLGVLLLAAEKAGWGGPVPEGRGRGLAAHASFGSFVAQVADVSVSSSGKVRVERVVCAVDCGQVVNPDTVEAQMESAILFGLTAALLGEITLAGGRVEQSNFHDYKMLRIDEAPAIEVYRVESSEGPGGIGEPGLPPIAPAVTNAVFQATGQRIRRLPIAA